VGTAAAPVTPLDKTPEPIVPRAVKPEPPVTPTGNTPVVICVALIPVGVPENDGEAFLE
jgi:hypothetical protein